MWILEFKKWLEDAGEVSVQDDSGQDTTLARIPHKYTAGFEKPPKSNFNPDR